MNALLKKIVWVIMLIPAVYLAVVWKQLPGTVATHFDIHGNPDKYGSKNGFLVFIGILIIVNIAIYLIITNIYRLDPKKNAGENKNRFYKIGFATTVFMAVVGCFVINAGLNGKVQLNIRILFSLMGFFWAIIGNYIHNIKPNYFAGFRLPWTLENADNWKKTHALAGKLMFGSGLILGIVCLFLPMNSVIIAVFSIMAVVVIIPCVYSYRLYKKQKTVNQ